MTQLDPNFHIDLTEEQKTRFRNDIEIEEVFQEIPSWFLEHYREAVRIGRIPKAEHRIYGARDAWNDAIAKTGRRCLWADHVGYFTGTANSQVLVAEPYRERIDDKALESLRHFCEIFNFEFKIEELSWHYPLRTCRIVFLRK